MSAPSESSWRAWGQTLRLSLAPSAAADAAVGALIGAAAWPAGVAPWLAIGASLLVYHGGMALNDWADREEDARVRPSRPIPSGRVRPASVLVVAMGLLLAGPLLLASVVPSAGLVLGGVSLAAALYDLAGRGDLRGPFLLALCRFGNLTSGLIVGAETAGLELGARHLALPIVYAAYVFVLSVLGRREDDLNREPGRLPSHVLHLASACLVAAPIAGAVGTAALEPTSPYLPGGLALAIWAALGLQRAAARAGDWPREDVVGVMGLLLRRLLIVTASAALASGTRAGLLVAPTVLLGYWVSHRLRRVFPPS